MHDDEYYLRTISLIAAKFTSEDAYNNKWQLSFLLHFGLEDLRDNLFLRILKYFVNFRM